MIHGLVQGPLGHVLYHLDVYPTQRRIHPAIHLNQNMRTPSHNGYLEMASLVWKHYYT